MEIRAQHGNILLVDGHFLQVVDLPRLAEILAEGKELILKVFEQFPILWLLRLTSEERSAFLVQGRQETTGVATIDQLIEECAEQWRIVERMLQTETLAELRHCKVASRIASGDSEINGLCLILCR